MNERRRPPTRMNVRRPKQRQTTGQPDISQYFSPQAPGTLINIAAQTQPQSEPTALARGR
jgi:hypothetical protein